MPRQKNFLITTSHTEEAIYLHQSENAWKPLYKIRKTLESNPEEWQREMLKRSVQSVLNKLTFEKFKVLLEALVSNISSEKEIDPIAYLVYENAIYEPKLSCIYATLCEQLKVVKLSNLSECKDQTCCSKVVAVILKICKEEFEDYCKKEELKDKTSSAEDRTYQCENTKLKLKHRRRGNIIFIGELFKLGVISGPEVREYIEKLIAMKDEESHDCLYRLLSISGKEMENGNALEQQSVQAYFTQIQDLVDKHLTCTRIRFLLQNLLDLQRNNWIPRKNEITPKTIEEIHKDMALETLTAGEQNKIPKKHFKKIKNKFSTENSSFTSNDLHNSLTDERACYSKGPAQNTDSVNDIQSHYRKKYNSKTAGTSSAFTSTVIQLHQCDNAWKPIFKLTTEMGYDTAAWEQEKLKRNVQSILNKLTFQKFKVLLSQLKLYISSGKEVHLVANLIYENAIYEPRFSSLYATLCMQLQKIESSMSNLEQRTNFSEVISNKCKVEFYKYSNVNSATNVNEKEKRKIKANRIGNVRFIGALFKVKVVERQLLEACICTLLSLSDEDALECLYWLIKTTNNQLESKVASEKNLIEDCFQKLKNDAETCKTSTRVRFLIQEVLDLKNNNWIPRREENTPRTIDEIHEEALKEKSNLSKNYQNKLASRKKRIKQKRNTLSTKACSSKGERPSDSKDVKNQR